MIMFRQQRVIKVVALALLFCVPQLCVRANPEVLTGRLATRGNKAVQVNGSQVSTGMTVLSGAQIVTPGEVGATVDLASLGQLDIAPNANLTLSFDDQNVTVNLTSGCATLTTNERTNGSITAKGTTERADAARGYVANICSTATGAVLTDQDPQDPAGTPGSNRRRGGVGVFSSPGATAIFLGVVGAVAVAAVITLTGDDDRVS